MELTIATAIAGIVALALSSLMVWAVVEFEAVKRRLIAQGEALRLEVMLRRYVTTAIKLKGGSDGVTNDPVNDLAASGNVNLGNGGTVSGEFDGHGKFARGFVYDQLSDWPPSGWQNVAVFMREWKEPVTSGGAATRLSDMIETGIAVRAPTATTSGVVFIDAAGDSPNGAMTFDYSDQWVGGIVEFSLEKKVKYGSRHMVGTAAAYTDSRLVSVLMTYKLRYHLATNLPKMWCPSTDVTNAVAGCTGGASFVDIERAVRIVFPNNNMGARENFGLGNEWIEDRPMGAFHFFRPVLPNVWEN